jgi:diacylglycerol O-acyltransferase / wax synthase
MAERFDDRMNQSDTTLWRIERDPELRTTILGVALLDGVPEWSRLRERIEAVSWEIPRLRQKVVSPAFGFGSPRWVADPSFDLDYHLRRVVVPQPGDLASVLTIAEPIVMAAFDRDRPLWEFTLVEGLAGGGSALLQKIHHCVTDGVGAIRMARLVFDEHDRSSADVPHEANGQRGPNGLGVVLGNLADQTRDALRFAGATASALPKAATASVLHPRRTATETGRMVRSIGKLVRPARVPMSTVMRERGMARRLASLEMSLDELKAAGHAAGGTMNDAFLAALTGGMRRYHDLHHSAVDRLRVTMPINLRTKGDAIGNNRFVPARFALPIGVADPRQRMHDLGEIARAWQHEPGIRYTDSVAGVLNALPGVLTTTAMASMLKAIDFVATNVPGLDHQPHLAGVAVVREFAFAPPSGAAFSAALLSHVDTCTLGLVIDTAAVPDPDALVSCMAAGFEEVLEVGRDASSVAATTTSKRAARAARH